MMAPQLYTHAFSICPMERRRLCVNGTPWILLLEECVGNAWECWSVVTGLISIVCFLFAALIVTAIFYVNMDIILISHFVFYKLKNLKMTKCSKSLNCFWITWILVWVALYTLLFQNSLDMIEMSGFICGYISSVFYLGSRFPQLYKNIQKLNMSNIMNKTNGEEEVYEESDLRTRPGAEAPLPGPPYRCSSLAWAAPNYVAQKINYNCYGLRDSLDNGLMKAYDVNC
ncbi:LOW QUALITY PROTEIN: lysosomal amino acid transporter 1 homolog [Phaethornis superciliosus]